MTGQPGLGSIEMVTMTKCLSLVGATPRRLLPGLFISALVAAAPATLAAQRSNLLFRFDTGTVAGNNPVRSSLLVRWLDATSLVCTPADADRDGCLPGLRDGHTTYRALIMHLPPADLSKRVDGAPLLWLLERSGAH